MSAAPEPTTLEPTTASPVVSPVHVSAIPHDTAGFTESATAPMESNPQPETRSSSPEPFPMIPMIPEEDLWTLVRRMNRQLYNVKSIDAPPPGRLDLNISDMEEFSPDKLRANIERFYITVIVGIVAFVKHIIRLRSWNERRRTTAFCCAYFLAWILNVLVPLSLSTLLALIIYPSFRTYLFPPVRLYKNASRITPETERLDGQKSGATDDNGASPDSLSGLPEARRGEAVEREARHFVANFATLIAGSLTGRTDRGVSGVTENERMQGEDSTAEGSLRAAIGSKKADVVGGNDTDDDKTKQPVGDVVWVQLRPVMHFIGDVCDNWERFANALSPTPPFSNISSQCRLAAVVVPLLLLSLALPAAVAVRAGTFIAGFAFFGQPVFDRTIDFLNLFYPNWRIMLQLRNTIFIGIPTNAQLTLTLLRLAEAHHIPIPPPPAADTSSPTKPGLTAAVLDITGSETSSKPPSTRKRVALKAVSLVQKTARVGVSAAIGIDKMKATMGNEPAKNRIGVLSSSSDDSTPDDEYNENADEFAARWKGRKGIVTVSMVGTIPCVAFCKERSADDVLVPFWSVALADILQLKKVGGFGWKGEMFLQLALGLEVAEGLEIVAKRSTIDARTDESEECFVLTAVQQRDGLFNRLLAASGRYWEIC